MQKNLRLKISTSGAKTSKNQIDSINTSIKNSIGNAVKFAASFVAIQKSMQFMVDGIKTAENYNTQIGIISKSFKNAGKDASSLTKDLKSMTRSLSIQTGVTQTAMVSSATMTSNFIKNSDIIKRSIPILNDWSSAMGTDLVSATKTFNQALSDPVRGMKTLERQGITLSKSQQDLVKSFVESGNKTGAYNIILDAMKDKFDGIAKETVNLSDQMTVLANNMKQSFGEAFLKSFSNSEDLVKSMDKLVEAMSKLGTKAGDSAEFLVKYGESITAVGLSVLGLVTIFKVVKGAMTALGISNFISKVVKLKFALSAIDKSTIPFLDRQAKWATLVSKSDKSISKFAVSINNFLRYGSAGMKAGWITSLGLFTAAITTSILAAKAWKIAVVDAMKTAEKFYEDNEYGKGAIEIFELDKTKSKIFTDFMNEAQTNTNLMIGIFNNAFKTNIQNLDDLKKAKSDADNMIISGDDDAITKHRMRVAMIQKMIDTYKSMPSAPYTKPEIISGKEENMEYLPDPTLENKTDKFVSDYINTQNKISAISNSFMTAQQQEELNYIKNNQDVKLANEEIYQQGLDAIKNKHLADNEAKKISAQEQSANAMLSIASQLSSNFLSIFQKDQQNKLDAISIEQEAMQNTARYKNANAESQAIMDAKFDDERTKAKHKQFELDQKAAISNIIINTATAAVQAYPNLILSGVITALGAAQIGTVTSQPNPYALGGDFITNGPHYMVVGDNPGGREHVSVTPLSSTNYNGPKGDNSDSKIDKLIQVIANQKQYIIQTVDNAMLSRRVEAGTMARGVLA